MTTNKQLEANRKNAKKGGVKTPEGKEVVKYNALKHGLLAKEVVITVGEGAESLEEFTSLLEDLKAQLNPVGSLEEMLVEKIAVAYWRLRRAYRYEVGLIRQELDTATDDYYSKTDWEGNKINLSARDVENEIEKEKSRIKYWKKDKRDLSKMYKEGKSLEEIYSWEENWDSLYNEVCDYPEGECIDDYLTETEDSRNEEIKDFLTNNLGWSDDRIWKLHIKVCEERIAYHKSQLVKLEEKEEQLGKKNALKLQVIKKLGNIPSKLELERLLRYEGAIEKQFYKALNQLERQQRLRSGDKVPAPIAGNLDINTN